MRQAAARLREQLSIAGSRSLAPTFMTVPPPRRTIESMYVRVANAIREAGLSRHPTDYLNFFCLAKREGPADLAGMGFKEPEPGSAAEEVRRSRRHPIYVHSKMTVRTSWARLLRRMTIDVVPSC